VATRALVPCAVYGAIACALSWPLVTSVGTAVLAIRIALADVLLIVWATAWGGHALATNPAALFEGNTFYPSGKAIVGSEHALGTLPIFAPVWAATGNPIAAFNVHLLLMVALSGLAMHVLVRRWTGSETAAYVAGIAFAAAPWRMNLWSNAPHLLATAYLPVTVLCLDRTLVRPSVPAVLCGAIALALEIACSFYLGAIALAGVAAYLVADLVVRGVRARLAPLLGAVALVAAAMLLVLPVTLPYLGTARSEPLGNALQDVPQFREIMRTIGAPWRLAWGWMGLGALALAASAPFVAGARREDPAWRVRVLGLTLALTVALLLAPGPGGLFGGRLMLHDAIGAWLPGFRSLRYAERFGVLASFAAAGLAGLAVASLRERAGGRVVALLLVLAAALQAPAYGGWNHKLVSIPTGSAVPPVYGWLAEHAGGAPVLELPTGFDDMTSEALAVYFSIYHWSTMLNGYTGYPPAESWLLKRFWTNMPDRDALTLLVGCTGLRWLVVHPGSPTRDAAWGHLAGIRLHEIFPRADGGLDRVFEVIDPTPTRCAERLVRDDVTLEGNPVVFLDRLDGHLALSELPAKVPTWIDIPVGVTLTNAGNVAWPGTAKDPWKRFALHVRWEPIEKGQADERWLALPGDVDAASERRFTLWIHAPGQPGRYRLVVTAAQGDFLLPPPEGMTPLRWETEGAVEIVPPVRVTPPAPATPKPRSRPHTRAPSPGGTRAVS
jgi:hypothetical protein